MSYMKGRPLALQVWKNEQSFIALLHDSIVTTV